MEGPTVNMAFADVTPFAFAIGGQGYSSLG